MQFLNRILEGRWLLYIGLAALAVGLPFSRALISIAPGILGGYWLFDGLYRKDFHLKFNRLRENRVALLFLAIFLIYVLGGLYSSDDARALKIIVNKLPWLVIPLLIGSSEPLPTKNWRFILWIHISAVIVSSICSYVNLLSMDSVIDPKSAILFVNHIRLSLMLVLAMVSMVFFAGGAKIAWKLLAIIVCIWSVFFMSTFEIATGLSISLILLLGLGLYAMRFAGLKRWLGYAALLVSLAAIGYVWNAGANQFQKPAEVDNQAGARTALGNSYASIEDNILTENGHYVWRFLAIDEMREEWNKRSDRSIDPESEEDLLFEGGLIRYMTSKDLRKDAEGIAALSEMDIERIEAGHPSVAYAEYSGIRKRLYMLFYEFDSYMNGGDPSLSSLTIKWEYWRTGVQLIRENPVLGVGTGDVRNAFESMQAKEGRISPEAYDKAHNQYLTWWVTFGLIIGSLVILAFIAPFFIREWEGPFIMLLPIYLVFLVSFITEDTLENQLGLNLFLFYAIFFILPRNQGRRVTSS